jgi:hypothetical protein
MKLRLYWKEKFAYDFSVLQKQKQKKSSRKNDNEYVCTSEKCNWRRRKKSCVSFFFWILWRK